MSLQHSSVPWRTRPPRQRTPLRGGGAISVVPPASIAMLGPAGHAGQHSLRGKQSLPGATRALFR
eukprot:8347347-Alexandrium_andersonii.AAC.1